MSDLLPPQSPLLCLSSPWNKNQNLIWLGSTVTLQRNIEKFNFPTKLSLDKRQQIISLLSLSLLATPQLKKPKVIAAEEMLFTEKEFLLEHFLTSQSFDQTDTGEAFTLDETGKFLAVINLKDHLMIEWIDNEEEVESAWEKLVKIEAHLSKSINFAFSSQFGFLTSNMVQSGTGLSVTIFLHLPLLIHYNRFQEIVKKNADEAIYFTGLQGDPEDMIGDIVALHNTYHLGLTEENILSSLRTFATKLIAQEKSARSYLKQASENEVADLKDKVSRAYGLLIYSYQIEAVEALQALSFLKLGLDLNWIKGTEQETLNELLFSCRRAHLLCHYKQNIHHEELAHKRSEFLHERLKHATLLV